ncbi:MAG: DUF2793 domain-containing protein [Alkalilacustris sp.]
MTVTPRLDLPLVQPAQAQKHVTVNEALLRLDCMMMLTLETRDAITPPAEPTEGQAFGLGPVPAGVWEGQGGRVAVFLGGGWVFMTPRRGWQAWIADDNVTALHDGTQWRASALALSQSGATSSIRVLEFDHEIEEGPFSTTSRTIPANVLVFAVTARVVEPIEGDLSAWQLGVEGALDRFGSGLGLAAGSFAHGLLGTPMAQYAAMPLVLTPTGSHFAGGRVRLVVHFYEPGLPGI